MQKSPTDYPGGKAGNVLVVQFTLAGQEYMALNGGIRFEYTNAISFKIDCADQVEVDHLWSGTHPRRRLARTMRLAQGSLRRSLADRALNLAGIAWRS